MNRPASPESAVGDADELPCLLSRCLCFLSRGQIGARTGATQLEMCFGCDFDMRPNRRNTTRDVFWMCFGCVLDVRPNVRNTIGDVFWMCFGCAYWCRVQLFSSRGALVGELEACSPGPLRAGVGPQGVSGSDMGRKGDEGPALIGSLGRCCRAAGRGGSVGRGRGRSRWHRETRVVQGQRLEEKVARPAGSRGPGARFGTPVAAILKESHVFWQCFDVEIGAKNSNLQIGESFVLSELEKKTRFQGFWQST